VRRAAGAEGIDGGGHACRWPRHRVDRVPGGSEHPEIVRGRPRSPRRLWMPGQSGRIRLSRTPGPLAHGDATEA